MNNNFESFMEELQNKIFEDTRAEFGDIAFQRWRKPLYMGKMENADGYGRITGSCGDTMEFFLKFEKDNVREASFKTNGCGSSIVCGSFAAELAIGKIADELPDITGDKILEILKVFPEEDRHCAFLAAEALQEALNDYMIHHVCKSDALVKSQNPNDIVKKSQTRRAAS